MANIELTEEQYKKLLDLVFLGRWMSTSMQEGDSSNDYDDIEQHLLKHAEAFNAANYVMYDKKFETFFTTRMLEEELDPYIEEYDEYTFWEQLAAQLAERDLAREIGPVSQLKEKHFARKHEIEDEYANEFAMNGLKNVHLLKK